jgi:uncharacterized protein HemY
VRGAALRAGQFSRFDRLAGSILARSSDTEMRAAVHAAIGRSWLDRGQPDQARKAFEAAIRECPGSEAAKTAGKRLYAMNHAAVGKPAPAFSAKTIDGAPVSLADFRGKVVFLNVWASW